MEYLKNPLYKKRVVFDGDSLTAADPRQDRFSWAKIIGERNEMEWKNFGVGGGTFTAGLYFPAVGGSRHWLSRSIDTTKERAPELDYLIFDGGVNDADNLRYLPEKFGEYSLADFSGKYDDTTYTGAIETTFYKAINHYPKAKIGYIALHKMGYVAGGFPDDRYDNYRKFLLRAIEICKKWGIPYIDLWETSTLNPTLPCYFNPSLPRGENQKAGMPFADGQHLATNGYLLIADKIEAWMRSL